MENVSFNIASEASYVYIFSGQKFMKKGQKWSILASFWKTVKQCYQTGQFLKWTKKFVKNARIQKLKCDILSNFQPKFKWDIFGHFQTACKSCWPHIK